MIKIIRGGHNERSYKNVVLDRNNKNIKSVQRSHNQLKATEDSNIGFRKASFIYIYIYICMYVCMYNNDNFPVFQ